MTGRRDAGPPGYTADPNARGLSLRSAIGPSRWEYASGRPSHSCRRRRILPSVPPNLRFPGGLFSYPYFAFHDAGARLFPGSWFSPAMAVAEALRTHCSFELALKWYKRAFDPLNGGCTWMVCEGNPAGAGATTARPTRITGTTEQDSRVQPECANRRNSHRRCRLGVKDRGTLSRLRSTPPPAGGQRRPAIDCWRLDANAPADAVAAPPGREGTGHSTCCDSSKVTDEVARQRAVTLHYCQTLIEWGDALMRRRRSPEAFQQARIIFDTAARITGRTPQTILLPEPASPPPVTAFAPANPPLNPRLMDLYSLVSSQTVWT